MSWIFAFLLAAFMAAVVVVPVYPWLRLIHVPTGISAVLSPAITVLSVCVIGEVWEWFGIWYSGLTVIPVLAIFGAVGFVFLWRRGRIFPKSASQLDFPFWLAIIVGLLVASLPWVFIAVPENPVQQWDPAFHMNGVWSIVSTGDGGWDSGLAPNYNAGQKVEYPAAWHNFVALFAVPTSVVLSSNASTLALMLLWVAGAGIYTRQLFKSRIAYTIAPVLAGGMLSMPGDALTAYNQWPNATALALLPGIAAYAIWLGRRFVSVWKGERPFKWIIWSVWVVALLLAIGGGIRAHPSLAFNLLYLLLAPVLVAMASLFWNDLKTRRFPKALVWPIALLAGIAVVCYAYVSPKVLHMGTYPRSGQGWGIAFGNILTPTPPYRTSWSLGLEVATVAILMVLGIIYCVIMRLKGQKILQWPIASFLIFAALVFVTYGPDNAFRQFIAAPWFLDSRRLMEPQNLTMIPLASIGFAWLAETASNSLTKYKNARIIVATALAGTIGIVSGGFGFSARADAAAGVYDPNRLGKPGMATAGELEMLRSLPDILPEGSVVMGDSQNGSIYAQVIGQRRALFPQLTLSSIEPEKKLLVSSFKDLRTNPEVCKAVKDLGVTHFYEDEDGYYYQTLRSQRTPGFYDVDVSNGFELVASGDTARVYKITACD